MTYPSAGQLTSIPREIAAVADYENFSRERLSDNAWEYLAGGAADELTLHDNRAGFDRIRLRSRVLADVRGGHTRLHLFGHQYEHPVFLAPVAYQKLFYPDGEQASAMGAAVMASCMVVSTLSSIRLEEIAAGAQAPLWFQLYFQADRDHTLQLVNRAEAAGYQALVVTVDAPLAGIRNREQRAGFVLPTHVRAANLDGSLPADSQSCEKGSMVFDRLMAAAPTWRDIEWLTSATRLPILLKGILDAEDALRALDCGVDGIVVSNHGGRIQDTVPASIDALPAIAAAVEGKVPLMLDGGIRRGSDIVKAIALGASAVLVGRPYIHALAVAGALGVAHVVRTLREELEVCMALNGCSTLQAIDRKVLFKP